MYIQLYEILTVVFYVSKHSLYCFVRPPLLKVILQSTTLRFGDRIVPVFWDKTYFNLPHLGSEVALPVRFIKYILRIIFSLRTGTYPVPNNH